MIKIKSSVFERESQPLIRHCWVYNLYKKKLSKISYKEKFVNFLTKDGKKAKAYKLFNKTGILIKRKIVHTDKINLFFEHHQEVIQRIKHISIQVNRMAQDVASEATRGDMNIYGNVAQEGSHLVTRPSRGKRNSLVTQNKKSDKVKKTKVLYLGLFKKDSLKKKDKRLLSFNQLLIQAVENVKPNLEVRKVRVGGTTYLVPAIIPKNRQETLAIKWLIGSARLRKRGAKGSFAENLANELIEALMKQGQARQKRDELHKLAEANRAYTRYRWW